MFRFHVLTFSLNDMSEEKKLDSRESLMQCSSHNEPKAKKMKISRSKVDYHQVIYYILYYKKKNALTIT